ncbi:glycosyltransferase family 2 protein [Tessaracoccus sp. Y1736]
MSNVSPPGLLSVVVPVYGVEDYLGACLESLVAQAVVGQIIVVNDASPDRSGEIAKCFEQWDSRVQVIDNAVNLGLGASRNVGMDHAALPYVAFVDSDDLATPGGYSAMVSSLESTGSDLATSKADEFAADGSRKRYWTVASPQFDHGAQRVRVRDAPELIRDHTAWTKVIRREFLIQQDIRWAQGTLCEDVVASAALFCRATAVDVVPVVSYLYRRRQGSITTDLRSDRPLGDWARQTARSISVVRELSSSAVEQELIDKILDFETLSRTGPIQRLSHSRNRAAAVATISLIAARASYATWTKQRVDTIRCVAGLLRNEQAPIPESLQKAGRELGILTDGQRLGRSRQPTTSLLEVPQTEPPAGPVVSCVMVTRDNAARCHDAVKSVLSQEAVDVELIVVDDSSSDDTWRNLERFARDDSRVRLSRSPVRGAARALNVGAQRARGRYLVFMRGVDLLPQRALAAMASTLDRSEDSMLIADRLEFDLKITQRHAGVPGIREPITGWSATESLELLRNPPLWNRLLRRSWWEQNGLTFADAGGRVGETSQLQCLLAAQGISVFPAVGFISRKGQSVADPDPATKIMDLVQLIKPSTPIATRRLLWSAYWPQTWDSLVEELQSGKTPDREAVEKLRVLAESLPETLEWSQRLCLELMAEGFLEAARAILAANLTGDCSPATAVQVLEVLAATAWAPGFGAVRVGYQRLVLRPLLTDPEAWSGEQLSRFQSASRELHAQIDLREVAVGSDARIIEAVLEGRPLQLRRELAGSHELASAVLSASAWQGATIEVDTTEERRQLLRLEFRQVPSGSGSQAKPAWFAGSANGRSASVGSRRNSERIGWWNVTAVYRDRFGLLRLPLRLRRGSGLFWSTASSAGDILVLRGRLPAEVALRRAVKRALVGLRRK